MELYVTIKDSYGKNIDIEVSYEIYKLFDDERKAGERERYERRKHLDDRELEIYSVAGQYCFPTTEDIFLNREKLREVDAILKTCTHIQQERFYLYRICSYAKVS